MQQSTFENNDEEEMCFEGTLFTQNGFTQQDLTLSGSGSSFNNIHSKKLNYISTTGKPHNILSDCAFQFQIALDSLEANFAY